VFIRLSVFIRAHRKTCIRLCFCTLIANCLSLNLNQFALNTQSSNEIIRIQLEVVTPYETKTKYTCTWYFLRFDLRCYIYCGSFSFLIFVNVWPQRLVYIISTIWNSRWKLIISIIKKTIHRPKIWVVTYPQIIIDINAMQLDTRIKHKIVFYTEQCIVRYLMNKKQKNKNRKRIR